jgi:hypothetical protein
MPFCPNCRYEYTEGATHCSTCGAPLVDELPPELAHEPRLGFAPADRVAGWFARGPFWRAWIETARQDLTAFPRLFLGGAAIVFRHPILYLLPLVLFAGHQWMVYHNTSAMASRGAYWEMYPREEESEGATQIIWKRVSALPHVLAQAFSRGRAGDVMRYPLPAVPVPDLGWVRTMNPNAPRWFGTWPAQATYWLLIIFLNALLYAGMFARLKSLMSEQPPEDFLSGTDRYFVRMAGLTAIEYGFILAWIYLFRSPWMSEVMRVVSPALSMFAFTFAPYAVVVFGAHVHRAIAAAVGFVLRHLPAVVVLLAAVTVFECAIQLVGPSFAGGPIAGGYTARWIPANLLLMLFGLCIWGMMMQWYVEATARERGPRPVSPEAPCDHAAETAAVGG